jgi:hypothetical protein
MNASLMTVNVALLERQEPSLIALALALDADSVIGKTLRVLAWYRNSDTTLATIGQVDDAAGFFGFATALCNPAIGWLVLEHGLLRPRGFLQAEVNRMHHSRRVQKKRKATSHVSVTSDPHALASHVTLADEIKSTEMEGGREGEGGGRGGYGEEQEDGGVEAQSSQESTEQIRAHALKTTTFVLPDWVPEDSWLEYLKMRQKIRKPLTDYGQLLVIRELEKLRRQGEDPRAMLEQSILRSWQGIFTTRGRDGRYANAMQPIRRNFDGLDYESGATREEDYPGWLKKDE